MYFVSMYMRARASMCILKLPDAVFITQRFFNSNKMLASFMSFFITL